MAESAPDLKFTSSEFEKNGNIPKQYTCDGKDINPPFKIEGVDARAKSLVIIMEDPDVPTYLCEDGMWDHWIKFNISVDTKVIEEGKEPEGVSGVGTSGNMDYHGPCPPDGEHRYIFILYSLDTELDLLEGSSKTEVREAMHGHILQKTELIGIYARNKEQ